MSGGIRSARERLRQTLCFEAGGLLLVAPLFTLLAEARLRDSLALIVVLTLLVMGWSALFNAVFDVAEHRLTGRMTCQRPQWLRVLHALLHEGSAVVPTRSRDLFPRHTGKALAAARPPTSMDYTPLLATEGYFPSLLDAFVWSLNRGLR